MRRTAMFVSALLALGLIPAVASAQQVQGRQVSGRVTRALGDVPVVGATVVEVGGPGVAQTGTDGTFRIVVGNADARLLVRAIGFQRKTLNVPASESNVVVTLDEDPFKLDAVVVTGQSTTIEKRNAPTAAVSVNSDDINRAPSSSLEQSLQGKVPGAMIAMNSGAPGGGAQMQIRGVTSILGAGQPLFVIDGVIMSNDALSDGANSVTGAGSRTTASGIGGSQDALVNRVADLNPQEIESVEILKSAAATAMYGSRATNGVVVIKTKRGSASGGSGFNFNGRLGRSVAYRLLGTRNFTTVDQVRTLPYGNAAGAADSTVLATLYPSGNIPSTHDYLKELYNNSSPSYEATGSYSGGSSATQYFVNMTAKNEQGTAPNTNASLMAARTNIDQSWLDGKIKVGVGLNVTRSSSNRGLSNNDNTCTSPVYCFAYTPGVINLDSTDATGTFVRNPFNGGGSTVSNPFETFQFLHINELSFRQIGTLNASWSALTMDKHQVSVTATGGFDRAQVTGDVFSPSFLQFESPASDGFSGRTVRSEGNILNYNLQFAGNWAFQPSPSISLTTSAGFDYETQYVRVIRTRARGLLPGVETTNSGTILDASDNVIGDFRDDALFATEQVVALDNKLTLIGGLRADRSSANGDRSKRYVYPRAAASYRFANLGTAINEVKIRGGWARTGNRPRYGDREAVLNAGTTIGGQPSLVQAGVRGNIGIKPEVQTELELGSDIQFLNNRMQFEGTWYNRRITDLLLQPATIPSGGITNLIINGGELKNTGVEAALTAFAVQQRDMDFSIRATFTKNRQTIENLPLTVPRFPAPGSFGAAFGRNFISPGGRTTWIWGNVPLDANNNPLPIGTLVTAGCNAGDPGCIIARIADTVAGDFNPDFVMGFSPSFRFKKLTLSMTLDWQKGGQVADMTRTLWDEGGTSRDYDDPINAKNMGPGWTVTGVPASYVSSGNTLPYTQGSYRYNAWSGGNDVRAYIESASNLSVRDISLGFDAPERWASTLGAKSMRVTLQGRNLFKVTNYWSFDPQFNNFGATNLNRFIDLAPFPSNRQFYLSVDLGW